MTGKMVVDKAKSLVGDNLGFLIGKLAFYSFLYFLSILCFGIGILFFPVFIQFMKIYFYEVQVKGNRNFKFQHVGKQILTMFGNGLDSLFMFIVLVAEIVSVLMFVQNPNNKVTLICMGASIFALLLMAVTMQARLYKKIVPYVICDYGDKISTKECKAIAKVIFKYNFKSYIDVNRSMNGKKILCFLTLGIYCIWYIPLSYVINGVFYQEASNYVLDIAPDPILDKIRKDRNVNLNATATQQTTAQPATPSNVKCDYDENGAVICQHIYDEQGRQSTSYQYSEGKLVSAYQYNVDGKIVAVYEYDANNKPTSLVQYDQEGNAKAMYRYNEKGEMVEVPIAPANNANN